MRPRSELKWRLTQQRELVGPVAHVGQPLGALDDAVEVVAVRDPQRGRRPGGVDVLATTSTPPKLWPRYLRANSSWLPGTKITRVPLRALRSSFCTTSLCACGQYQLRRSCQPSMMSPTRYSVSQSTVRRKSSSARPGSRACPGAGRRSTRCARAVIHRPSSRRRRAARQTGRKVVASHGAHAAAAARRRVTRVRHHAWPCHAFAAMRWQTQQAWPMRMR
jgi:hypothetical protein